MSSVARYVIVVAVSVMGVAAAWTSVLANRVLVLNGPAPETQQAAPRGQTTTRLPDGGWLIIGGEVDGEPVATATIVDPNGAARMLRLGQTRAWHSATVLPDGTVLIAGGSGRGGQVVGAADLFDPATGAFVPFPVGGSAARTGHTATLLTDGRVLVFGGTTATGEPAPAEVWTFGVGVVTAQAIGAAGSRSGHTATLLADGRVLLAGGISADGAPRDDAAVFDPATATVAPAAVRPDDPRAPAVVETQPADGAEGVPPDVRIAVRFSTPLTPGSVSASLTGPDGAVDLRLVAAEDGRLLFLTPQTRLQPESRYALAIRGGAEGLGVSLRPHASAFVTAREETAATPEVDTEPWAPDAAHAREGWKTGRPPSPWQDLPPLEAPAGTTALSGQVLRLDGRPLMDTRLAIGEHEARTDRTGRFLLLLPGVSAGRHELEIDGRTASRGIRRYGFFEYGLEITPGRTTVLPFTIWMPRLDTAHAVAIASPTTRETVITTPLIPGLELHLSAGTTIRDEDGDLVREVSITPIPVDRPPFPLPRNSDIPLYFTIQPGGAYVSTSGPYTPGVRRGAWLVYPNYRQESAGKRIQFYHYDPPVKGWYVYGLGTVTPDERQVVPDLRTRLYAFTGAMINSGASPPADGPPPGDCCGNDGDPVNLATGLFTLEQTDVVLPDVLPIAITRSYRSRDPEIRRFGRGTTHPYEMFLWSAQEFEQADLVLPDGAKIHYVRVSDPSGPGPEGAVFEHVETAETSATPTAFYRSVLAWNGAGWDLRLKDGTVYVFGDSAPLQAIRDRYGNTITIARLVGGIGPVARVTSPHGRWFEFTYEGPLISEIKDNIGRTWRYTYDSNSRLWKVTDPMDSVTEFTYDANHNMKTVKNRNGVVYVTNDYTTAADAPTPVGWVKKQTFADGGTYQFIYSVTNGKSTQTDVTNPRGFIRRITFNPDGYTLSETGALGTSNQEVRSSTRQGPSNLITGLIGPDGSQTNRTLDSAGNMSALTRLAGTPNEVTTTYTYDPIFHEVTSVTDPLNHTRTLTYDTQGRLTAASDAQNRETVFTYNAAGQLLTVEDPLHNVSRYEYAAGDLVTIIDPLEHSTTRFVDSVGRVSASADQYGRTTRYAYNALDRLISITDPLGAITSYTYLPEGQLASVTDPKGNMLNYAYDALGRTISRTDGLEKSETFSYDLSGNLIQHIDRKGQLTTYSYDALNRLERVTYADASTTNYEYNAYGRVSEIVDSTAGTMSWTFDAFGRITGESGPSGGVTYQYDAAGRQTTMTAAGQSPVMYGYDVADQLTSITQDAGVITYAYDGAGRRTSTTLPNGIITNQTYDAASRLIELTYFNGATPLGSLTYSYDMAGRRIETGGSFARIVLPQAIASASYDAGNRLTGWGTLQLSYDENGNVVSDGPSSFVWNARNLLTARLGPSAATFGYDAIGRRVAKSIDGASTAFAYDGYDVVQEQPSGLPASMLLRGGGIDELISRSEAGTGMVEYPLLDALGSTIATVDSAGNTLDQFQYEPFGRTVNSDSSAGSAGYTGREQDDSELYYYRARYYSPALGRFLSEDPVGLEDGVNFYSYAHNDPINLRDPTGTVAITIEPLKINVWPTLDGVVAACGGRLTYWGCGGLKDAKFGCECIPDGCGKYAPKVTLSGALGIEALAKPRNATVEEVIYEEMKHVRAAKRGIETFRRDAEAFEKNRYSYKWTCDFACWRFNRRAKNKLNDEIEAVHRTDPHPRR